jgi:hypothetical protein
VHPASSTIVCDGGEPIPEPAGGDSYGRAGFAGALLLVVGLGALFAHLLNGLDGRFDSLDRSSELASAPSEPVALVGAPIAEAYDAVADVDPAGNRPVPALTEEEELGRWALDQIGFPWEDALPGWRISFYGERPGLYGLTLVDDKHIEIYVRNDQEPELLVHIVAHEIGHAVDVTMNDGPDRRRWQEARGIGTEPWWPGEAASDFATGAGDFAEGFAFWQAGPEHFRSKVAPPPNEQQLALLAELATDRQP